MSSDRTGDMPKKPPTLRARQAQLTRDEILGAARRLFAEQGYSRTSVRDIAEAAGVSAQTVYDSIGSKQADRGPPQRPDRRRGRHRRAIAGAGAGSGDPEQVAGGAGQGRSARSSSTAATSSAPSCPGAAAEPDLALVLAEGHRRHVEGARRIVGLLAGARRARNRVGHRRTRGRHPQRHHGRQLRPAAAATPTAGHSTRIEAWITATNRSLLLGHR